MPQNVFLIYLKTDYSLPAIKFFCSLPVPSHLANTELPVFFEMLAK